MDEIKDAMIFIKLYIIFKVKYLGPTTWISNFNTGESTLIFFYFEEDSSFRIFQTSMVKAIESVKMPSYFHQV